MNFKRHWNGEYGVQSIYKKENSACKGLEIDMLRLAAGESVTLNEDAKESVLTLLSGNCDITGRDIDFKNIGKRKNVFDGKAYAAYIPCKHEYTVKALTDLVICTAKCPSTADYKPVLITPDDIVVKFLGKPGFEREAHFLVDERLQASKIYVGENFIQGGQWSSYPGHKHDTENMPKEGFAEEIYYYEFDKPTGYGIQQVYTSDRTLDEAYPVRNNDFVEIPRGYHPCTVAAGYKGYLLWMMCCETKRGFYMSTDPEHEWLTK